jgi:hypothetical protein
MYSILVNYMKEIILSDMNVSIKANADLSSKLYSEGDLPRTFYEIDKKYSELKEKGIPVKALFRRENDNLVSKFENVKDGEVRLMINGGWKQFRKEGIYICNINSMIKRNGYIDKNLEIGLLNPQYYPVDLKKFFPEVFSQLP